MTKLEVVSAVRSFGWGLLAIAVLLAGVVLGKGDITVIFPALFFAGSGAALVVFVRKN